MEEVRQSTVEALQQSLQKTQEEGAQRQRLERVAHSMVRRGFASVAVGAEGLQGLLDILHFERGFIFLAKPSGNRPAVDPEAVLLQPVVSRMRAAPGEPAEWGEVLNPEFAINRSVVKRCLASGQPMTVNDCLLQPTPQGEESHRTVICQPFELVPGEAGIIYLDRGLGLGGVGENEQEMVLDFTACCLPIFARACLAERLALLGSVPTEASEEADEGDDIPVPEEPEVSSFHGLVGRSEKLQKIFNIVRKVKDSDLNICIFGESGTGKELLARAIHEAGARREKAFVAENCGAFPENLLESELFGHKKGSFTGADDDRQGLFEIANGGTLFLDEIGDMSEGMQRKLLRVLQENVIRPIGAKQGIKVNVRVICASNRDLRTLVQKGTFRADLYYRLNVITLELPPLRERREDIPILVSHAAGEISKEEGVKKRFSQSAMKALCLYSWPGNIRELRNVIRKVFLTCPRRLIARKDIAPFLSVMSASACSGANMDRDNTDLVLRIPAKETFNEIIEECERVVLYNALQQNAWNKSKVTKALKIPRQSLYNKIAKYSLERTWGAEDEGLAGGQESTVDSP